MKISIGIEDLIPDIAEAHCFGRDLGAYGAKVRTLYRVRANEGGPEVFQSTPPRRGRPFIMPIPKSASKKKRAQLPDVEIKRLEVG